LVISSKGRRKGKVITRCNITERKRVEESLTEYYKPLQNIRFGRYTAAIGRKMGLDSGFVKALLYAAPMHDIDKVGIPDNILMKPGKLNIKEWEIM
jgi:HD-GYP domain-containing protein (c-di-GMP phosphodiesterase class II)